MTITRDGDLTYVVAGDAEIRTYVRTGCRPDKNTCVFKEPGSAGRAVMATSHPIKSARSDKIVGAVWQHRNNRALAVITANFVLSRGHDKRLPSVLLLTSKNFVRFCSVVAVESRQLLEISTWKITVRDQKYEPFKFSRRPLMELRIKEPKLDSTQLSW